MSTPTYTKRAVDKYRSRFDLVSLRLPKGTRARLEALNVQNVNEFITKCVIDQIIELELATMPTTRTETGQKSILTDGGEHLPIEDKKQLKTANKAVKGDNLDFLQSMQAIINQRREDLKADNEKPVD